ncbi:hypothetical protein BH24CHL4_BH24CHL4_20190 [soil metagenome]
MSFAGRLFIETAELLSVRGSVEQHQRTALSRGYYAAYWHARDFCKANNVPLDPPPGFKGGGHKYLQDQLVDVDIELSMTMIRLFDKRIQADYRPHYHSDLTRDVVVQIEDARKVINKIDALALG